MRRGRAARQPPRDGATCTALLLEGPAGTAVIVPWRPTPCQRVLWRLRGPILDAELRAGFPPQGDGLRSLRAQYLVSTAHRRRLADDWERLLAEVRSGGRRSARRLVHRQHVLAADREIEALARTLRSGAPLAAAGVALARSLLSDGAGPVYRAAPSDELGTQLRTAISAMGTDELFPAVRRPTGGGVAGRRWW